MVVAKFSGLQLLPNALDHDAKLELHEMGRLLASAILYFATDFQFLDTNGSHPQSAGDLSFKLNQADYAKPSAPARGCSVI